MKEERDFFVRNFERVSFAVGETIFDEGDLVTGMYLISRGDIKILKTLEEDIMFIRDSPRKKNQGQIVTVGAG